MILTKLRFENQQKKTPQAKKTKASFISEGLSAMILSKLRFENQQKKTPQAKKTKASFIF